MKRLAVLMMALAAVAAACGGGGDDDEPTVADDPSEEPSPSAGPVTIEHRYGETTIETAPERIVTIDNQWLDVLLALDAPVVAAVSDPYVDGGRYPWQELAADVEQIPASGEAIPFEAIAAARPDLIVVTFAAQDEATYDTLSDIAPTIPLLGEEEVDAWEDIAATAGRILDEAEAAQALVDDADAAAAALAEELPGLDGKTYAMANYVAGDGIYVIADPEDGAAQLFYKLGLTIDPEILAEADGAAGRVQLSTERIDELDSDLVLMLTNDSDPNEIPGYANLPAVQSGAIAIVDFSVAVALNTPSGTSVAWAVDQIRPALEAAAA